MPFITKDRRKKIDEQGLESLSWIEPGDRCYPFYKRMVERWRAAPRWTTAHEIYKEVRTTPVSTNSDDEIAYELAWQVFFQLYVMPYEKKRRKENGDI